MRGGSLLTRLARTGARDHTGLFALLGPSARVSDDCNNAIKSRNNALQEELEQFR